MTTFKMMPAHIAPASPPPGLPVVSVDAVHVEADEADRLGQSLLQACATVARVIILPGGGLHDGKAFRPSDNEHAQAASVILIREVLLETSLSMKRLAPFLKACMLRGGLYV